MNYDFSPERLSIALDMLKNDMPYALWETLYATVLATLFAVIIGLPLGILLAVGTERTGSYGSRNGFSRFSAYL